MSDREASVSVATSDDVAGQHLDVYDGPQGWWNPDLGLVEVPEGWELLPSGDAYVTRQIKRVGVYWVAWRPRGKNRPHRRRLGLLAPTTTIEVARAAAVSTEGVRAERRGVNSRSRERAELRASAELADAVRAWLGFAPDQAALADEIADAVAAQATVVGSGRVGRTRTLTIEERAALAARAYIRHRHTTYEQRLEDLSVDLGVRDDAIYRQIKRDAQSDVDDFLAAHRRRSSPP